MSPRPAWITYQLLISKSPNTPPRLKEFDEEAEEGQYKDGYKRDGDGGMVCERHVGISVCH